MKNILFPLQFYSSPPDYQKKIGNITSPMHRNLVTRVLQTQVNYRTFCTQQEPYPKICYIANIVLELYGIGMILPISEAL